MPVFIVAMVVYQTVLFTPQRGPGVPHHWAIEFHVPHAGLYSIPLSRDVLDGIGLEGTNLRFIDPEGNVIRPWMVKELNPGFLQIQTIRMKNQEPNWVLEMDTQKPDWLHTAVHIRFKFDFTFARCTLESSSDGSHWVTRSSVDWSQLKPPMDVALVTLRYPPVTDRYLRLHFYAVRDTFKLIDLSLEPAEMPLGEEWMIPVDGKTIFTKTWSSSRMLVNPVPSLRPKAFELRWTGPALNGYRVFQAWQGTWNLVAEGGFLTEEEHSIRIPLSSAALSSNMYRMDLYYNEEHPPQNVAVHMVFDRPILYWYAPKAGFYRLEYGPGISAPKRVQPLPDLLSFFQATPLALPAGKGTPVGPLYTPRAASSRLQSSYSEKVLNSSNVHVRAHCPHGWAKLELPANIYEKTQRNLGNLRLVSGQDEIPYIFRVHDNPELISVNDYSLASIPLHKNTSRVILELPHGRLPLSGIEIESMDVPFQRMIRIYGLLPTSTKVESSTAIAESQWVCPLSSQVPCRIFLPIYDYLGSRLRLDIDHGDNPPLKWVSIRLWRFRHTLLFPCSANQSIKLLTLSPDTPLPNYDIEQLTPILSFLTFDPAKLIPQTPEPGKTTILRELSLPGAVIFASLLMLFLLYRMLSRIGDT